MSVTVDLLRSPVILFGNPAIPVGPVALRRRITPGVLFTEIADTILIHESDFFLKSFTQTGCRGIFSSENFLSPHLNRGEQQQF